MKCVTGCVVTAFAMSTLETGNMMRNKDAVTNLDIFYFIADLRNYACGFMPQDTRCFGNTVPFNDVAAADSASHNLEQSFLYINSWVWDFLDADVVVVVVKSG